MAGDRERLDRTQVLNCQAPTGTCVRSGLSVLQAPDCNAAVAVWPDAHGNVSGEALKSLASANGSQDARYQGAIRVPAWELGCHLGDLGP
jgi:hypothetical protein